MSSVPEGNEVAQPADLPVEAEAVAAPETPDQSVIEYNGQQYDRATVQEAIDGFENLAAASAAQTQRNQQDAEARRQVEEMRVDLEQRLAEANTSTVTYPDEVDDVTRLENSIKELRDQIAPVAQNIAASQAQLERESAFDTALSSYATKPLADTAQMRTFLDERSLGPEHADLAYMTLYGKDLGVMIGSSQAADRSVAPVLGSGGYNTSTGWTGVGDVPQAERPMSEVTVEELVQRGMNDPEI